MSNSFVLLDSEVTDGFTHFRVPSTWHHSQDRHARRVVKLRHTEQRFLSNALASSEDVAPERSEELYCPTQTLHRRERRASVSPL